MVIDKDSFNSFEEIRFYVGKKEIIYKIRSDYVRNDRSKINR